MRSKQEQLKNRGFIPNEVISEFENISFNKKINLLVSKIASERTLGARLLKEDKTQEVIAQLINALKVENKLYSKIEICNTLSQMNELAIDPLIKCLGMIGSNQHKTVPEKEFHKDSYPLPRDIAGRVLIRIGEKAIPKLLRALETNDTRILPELIDVIGHINFNSKLKNNHSPLIICYNRNSTSALIKWKIIRAFSGIVESEPLLNKLYLEEGSERLQKEIERSLRLINR